MGIIQKLRQSYRGTLTVRDTALFLRATTPRPETPVAMWKPRPKSFVATSRALYAWIRLGLEWDEPVRVSTRDRVVTFEDLVRLRMIALLRARGLRYAAIRNAERYARELTGLPQPFVSEALWTAVSDVFMRFQDHLLSITREGQFAFPLETLRDFLTPVYHGLSFDAQGSAEVWSPRRGVTIDPEIQFGAPCVTGTRIETEALWSFKEAGETPASLARLYRLKIEQVDAALEWEQDVSLAA